MAKTLKDVFDDHAELTKFDNDFVSRAHKYERAFVNKNEDNIVFLGNGLMGTPRFIYSRNDRDEFFDEVVKIDEGAMKNDVYSLPHIDPSFNVASDPLNLTIAYTVHRLMTSTLSASKKEEGMIAVLKVMHYRFLSSLMSNYFKYEPDKAIAQAVYYALNRKFSLKVTGSWAALIQSRCEDIISTSSIHYDTLMLFRDDAKIQYFISDTQGRIRNIVKAMYLVFLDVHKNSAKVITRKDMVDLDGTMHVRDLVRDTSAYKRYAHTIISERDSFYKEQLVSVITNLVHTASPRNLTLVLEYMSNNYGPRGDRRVEKLIDETLIHAFQFIAENRSKFSGGTNLPEVLSSLKSLYMSSRTTDPSILKMRKLSYDISKKAIVSNNASLIASLRTAVMLYIVLRTLTMNYYS